MIKRRKKPDYRESRRRYPRSTQAAGRGRRGARWQPMQPDSWRTTSSRHQQQTGGHGFDRRYLQQFDERLADTTDD